MENYSRKGDDGYPQLVNFRVEKGDEQKGGGSRFLKLMAEREWNVKREGDDEEKLELSLGLPGGDWMKKSRNNDFSKIPESCPVSCGNKMKSSPWSTSSKGSSSFLQLSVSNMESSLQPCCNKSVDLQTCADNKAFSSAEKTHVPNSSQKRSAPVVGWPPIRSFRRNIASSSSLKPVSQSPNESASKKPTESNQNSLFVKINMDGIPIGRKADIKALDSYEKLSSAVDHLFRGLLAAQNDSTAYGVENKDKKEKAITGLLDGSGEYTLVYEDNEGDRMLVGDVPWHMFVSTVKRLRVLRTSELPMLCRAAKQGKLTLES